MQFIHNGVKSKKMYFDGQSMWGAEVTDDRAFYITHDGGSPICLTPGYTMTNNTHVKITFVPGYHTGDYWIGTAGSDPNYSDDNDYRVICYDPLSGETAFDLHDQRELFPYILDENTPKVTMESYNYGVKLWDANNNLIGQWNWTTLGAFDTNVPVWLNTVYHIKVYSVLITDDSHGTIFDGVVDENGFFDRVSNSYITLPSGWTVEQES